jgi:hypothetical protein
MLEDLVGGNQDFLGGGGSGRGIAIGVASPALGTDHWNISCSCDDVEFEY